MKYELFLRAEQPLDEAVVAAARTAVSATGPALSCEPFVAPAADDDAGSSAQVRGLDLGVPVETPEAADALLTVAFALAARFGFAVFDPQLGRVIHDADQGEVREQVARAHAFVDGQTLSSSTDPSRTARLPPKLRLWGIVLALLALLFVLSQLVTRCALAGP